MTQAQREEKDHEDKRQRHRDTLVTEGNRDTEEWLYLSCQAYQQKARHQARCQCLKSLP